MFVDGCQEGTDGWMDDGIFSGFLYSIPALLPRMAGSLRLLLLLSTYENGDEI